MPLKSSRPMISLRSYCVATPSIGDVEVSSKMSIEEVYGMNRRTGKPGKMAAIVFEATVTS